MVAAKQSSIGTLFLAGLGSLRNIREGSIARRATEEKALEEMDEIWENLLREHFRLKAHYKQNGKRRRRASLHLQTPRKIH